MPALLLDRLVRQGRAFGIHVLLGSQTLSGAYSLARSTMGQMAVRVALQCSEADAHLILSDERNMAARYLEPPGRSDLQRSERPAGRQSAVPSRVAPRVEARRTTCARSKTSRRERGSRDRAGDRLRRRSGGRSGRESSNSRKHAGEWHGGDAGRRAQGLARRGRGDQGADVRHLRPPRRQQSAGRRQRGRVGVRRAGQRRDRAGGAAARPRFFVLDGTRPDSPLAGAWQRLADALPNSVTVAGPRDTARVIAEVAAEVARREAAGEEDAPPLVLDRFTTPAGSATSAAARTTSASRRTATSRRGPIKQWAEILRNGPAWGVHSLVWCDSYNDVNRLVDRLTLREFELRVVFQMSAADSTNLLDTPAASRLRQHRGLFYSDDLGTQEKFRPYGPPSEAWLAHVRRQLSPPTKSLGS